MQLPYYLVLLIAVAVFVISIGLGNYLARAWRMPDYGWKLALIFFAFLASGAVLWLRWPPKLGIDLRGGAMMVYEIDRSKMPSDQKVDMPKLIEAISRRVNPGGLKEVTIRPYGAEQVEVIIPNVSKDDLRQVKNQISLAGTLEFRILANKRDHTLLVKRALAEENLSQIRDSEGNLLGWWVPLAVKSTPGIIDDPENITRIRKTRDGKVQEVLVVNDDYNVTGAYLQTARSGESMEGPTVNFSFNNQGAQRFGGLTSHNLPDEVQNHRRKLGIILNGELCSAPYIKSTITDSGQISGGHMTKKEVDETVSVLNAGSLPAALSKEPISEVFTGPTLGADTIRMSTNAMIISAILVPLFMLWYYRFAGLVANIALVLNMMVLVAVMITFHAAFTLPGLAGLALTVGMAVDNNVLLYERMREELHRGATLRMAIRNAFHRVSVVIVDANLTHLIAATVLFAVGTEQVKGFAITFWLGAVLSMWTSMFVARVVFDIAERRQWLTKLKMMHVIGDTHIDFMAWFPAAATFSVLITVLGLVVAFYRGKGLFDIDFTGGVSIQAVFREPMDVGAVRAAVEKSHLEDVAVNDIRSEDIPKDTQFIINTSEQSTNKVQETLKEAFGDKLLTNTVTIAGLQAIESPKPPAVPPAEAKPAPKVEKPAPKVETPAPKVEKPAPKVDKPAEKPAEKKAEKKADKPEQPPAKKPADKAAPGDKEHSRNDLPADNMLAMAGSDGLMLAEAPAPATAEQGKGKEKAKAPSPPGHHDSGRLPQAGEGRPEAAPKEKPAVEEASTAGLANLYAGGAQTKLTFQFAVNHKTAVELVQDSLRENQIDVETMPFELTNPEYSEGDKAYSTWELKIKLPPARAEKVLKTLQKQVADVPYFPGASQIGGLVAGSTRMQAIYALVTSWVLIIIYLWVRFQGVAFGLAAVIALIHDVLVMLGGIAFSYYIAPWFGFLMIDPFKINLPIVAAFLTIIGYSVNDTIVVFDRIREVRGKDPRMTRQMVNDSTNQTLSRTLLTSFTVFLVVIILYIFGGQAIHGFAFALLIGVATGTYSSIYVAAPILLWLIHPKAMSRSHQ